MPQLRNEVRTKPVPLRTAATFLAVFAAGILIGRVRIGESIWPFGAAYVLACFLNSKYVNPYIAFAGVLMALCTMIFEMQYVEFNFVAASICAVAVTIMRNLRLKVDRRLAMIVAVGSYIICTLCFKTSTIYTVFSAAAEMCVCLISIVIMDSSIKLVFDKNRKVVLTDEEIISAVIACMLIVLGLGELNIAGVYLRSVAAIYIGLTAAYLGGAAVGACAGAAVGIAAILGGEDPIFMSSMAVASLAGGVARPLKKPAVVAAFVLTNVLLTMYFSNMISVVIPIIDNFVAGILFMVTPKRAHEFLARYVDVNLLRERTQSMHIERFREITVGRLNEIAGVLKNASEMFKDLADRPANEKDVSYLIAYIPETACKDCVFGKVCWNRDLDKTMGIMQKLYNKYIGGKVLDEKDLGSIFLRRCVSPEKVIEAAKNVFYRYETNAKWRSKVMESRMVVGEQLAGVSKVIESLGREAEVDLKFKTETEERIRMKLEAAGICTREVCAEIFGNKMTVRLEIKECGGSGICGEKVEKILSKECGTKMIKNGEILSCLGKKYCTVQYEQARNYTVYTGIAAVPKHGNTISGDAHSFNGLDDGRYMMLMCDGMGNGERAAKESRAAVSLMEDFYHAGFDDKTIIETINKLLILSSDEEMFSTMDLCMLNLINGKARFTKIGAPHSYVVRENCVKRINAGALPLGILDDFTPAFYELDLENGDMLVMFTDGVADLEIKDETFTQVILESVSGTAQEAADKILMAALAKMQGTAEDDITVMVTKVRENAEAC